MKTIVFVKSISYRQKNSYFVSNAKANNIIWRYLNRV